LQVVQKSARCFEVSFKVKNTGKYDGEEVAQLYMRDEYASVVQPMKQLKHFERFYLSKGEEKLIVFTLAAEDLSIINQALEQIVESGTFQVMIGSSSDDIRLEGSILVK
jgi:beta-glucosidase